MPPIPARATVPGQGLWNLGNLTVSADGINDGTVRLVAELGPYQEANNPDGTDINSNSCGLRIAADGTIYVADAGRNTIYQIAPDTGPFSLFAALPNLTDLTGATLAQKKEAIPPGPQQAVPASVAIGPDSTISVGYCPKWGADRRSWTTRQMAPVRCGLPIRFP